MPKPCSLDLRMRLLEAVIAGASRRDAADCFDVSASSAVKWLQLWMKWSQRRASDGSPAAVVQSFNGEMLPPVGLAATLPVSCQKSTRTGCWL
jgi:hypothetical protein